MGLGEGGRKRAAAMWYLVGLPSYKNLVEAVERTLAGCRAEIRKNAQASVQREETEVSKPLVENTEFVCVENWKPAPDLCTERERMTRRAERHDRYQQVIELHGQGLGSTEIAQRVGLTARTIQRWRKRGCLSRSTAASKTAQRF